MFKNISKKLLKFENTKTNLKNISKKIINISTFFFAEDFTCHFTLKIHFNDKKSIFRVYPNFLRVSR